MSTPGAARGPGNARNTEGPDITSSHGEEIEGTDEALARPPAEAAPPHGPYGIQLHVVDRSGLSHRCCLDRLPVPLVTAHGNRVAPPKLARTGATAARRRQDRWSPEPHVEHRHCLP
jgi:hypothetical protein